MKIETFRNLQIKTLLNNYHSRQTDLTVTSDEKNTFCFSRYNLTRFDD